MSGWGWGAGPGGAAPRTPKCYCNVNFQEILVAVAKVALPRLGNPQIPWKGGGEEAL